VIQMQTARVSMRLLTSQRGITHPKLLVLPLFCQVSVDVPWSPYDIDGRNYEWAALALAADLLFVMAYDTQVGR
jgi:hypothetical protein